jgi:hypothetical protein
LYFFILKTSKPLPYEYAYIRIYFISKIKLRYYNKIIENQQQMEMRNNYDESENEDDWGETWTEENEEKQDLGLEDLRIFTQDEIKG